tara:strand:+ start:11828 stop:12880 length:1053 start_codon:yes stop_codon:yes gene_type:complete
MISNKSTSSQWLIGGPSRCGKSTLADVIANTDVDGLELAVLKVDALLHVYRNKSKFKSDDDARLFLQAYLERPRYMNPERTITLCPADDINVSIEEIISRVNPLAGMKPLEVIFRLFDFMAESNDKCSWLALDLLPEIYFCDYKKKVKGLKLLIVLRDPVESIAAGLYWRTYPNRSSVCGKKTIDYLLFLWCLSALTTLMMKKKYPDDVYVVSSNDLFSEKSKLPDELENIDVSMEFKKYYSGVPYFNYERASSRHYCPDGTWQNLLSKEEVCFINAYKKKYSSGLFSFENSCETSFNNRCKLIDFLIRLAEINPVYAKLIADHVYVPKQLLANLIEISKNIVKKLLFYK